MQGKGSISPSARLFHFFPFFPPPIGGITMWDMSAAYFSSTPTPTSPASCGRRVGVALEIRGLVIRGSSDADRRHEASPVVGLLPRSSRAWNVWNSSRTCLWFLNSVYVCCQAICYAAIPWVCEVYTVRFHEGFQSGCVLWNANAGWHCKLYYIRYREFFCANLLKVRNAGSAESIDMS